MRYIEKAKYALIVFLAVFFEMLFCKYIQIGGAVPMLTFCLVMTIAAFEKNEENVIFSAIFAGVALDILSGHGFGTYTVIFFACAICAFCFAEKIFSSKLLFLVVATFILTIFAQTAYYLLHISNILGSFWALFASKVIPTALYNVVISGLFYPMAAKIYRKRR